MPFLRNLTCLFALASLSFSAFAGSLDSTAAPDDPASAMYTVDDIYYRLNDGTIGAKRGTGFTGPTAGPASTGPTLDDVMDKAPVADNTSGAAPADVASDKTYWGLRTDGSWGPQTGTGTGGGGAGVEKSGQTTSYATGDDGDLEKGVAWPSPRFTDNGDGTVTDNMTALIWLKNANCYGTQTWTNAISSANGLNSGECGLSDGSVAGDWRLPNVKELHSLIDFSYYSPALSNAAGTGQWSEGDAFSGVQSSYYWSSTTYPKYNYNAWYVHLNIGSVQIGGKTTSDNVVWPVRGGQ